MARRHLRIDGRVQGVGYRASAVARMRELGLHGWARNLADGRVEVVAEGGAAALAALEAWCATGPRWARVTQVVGRDEEPEGLTSLEIR
jgi:acylphosphatase